MKITAVRAQSRDFSLFLKGLYIISLALTLWASWEIVYHTYGAEADSIHSLLIWHGVKSEGLSWIKDWIFTPDNWLLSLVPIEFLLFSIFGAKASVSVAFGYVIYVLNALISALIIAKIGGKKSAPWIFLALTSFGLYMHLYAYISYATTHNITNLYGLIATLILSYWLEKPSFSSAICIAVILFLGAISDPWMIASYNLPILISGLIFLLILKNIDRKKIYLLCLLILFSLIAARSKAFGLLNFLESYEFTRASWKTIDKNSFFLIKDLGGMINIVPLIGNNSLIGGLISISAALYLSLSGGYKIISPSQSQYEKLSRSKNGLIGLICVALISCSGVSVAFLLSATETNDASARFLINVPYFLIMIIAIAIEYNWNKFNVHYRLTAKIAIGGFAMASVTSIFPYVINAVKSHDTEDTSTVELIDFLKKNGLTYGYGPYWGSKANALTMLSQGQVTIRPVSFDVDSGRMSTFRHQSSKRWYTNKDIPAGTSEFFVYVVSDGEECPDINICVSGLINQFGTPKRILNYNDAQILVWNHSLLVAEDPSKTYLGKTYFLTSGGNLKGGNGWGQAENWGTWTNGQTADIDFNFDRIPGDDLEISLNGVCFVNKKHPSNHVSILANGKEIASFDCNQYENPKKRIIRFSRENITQSGALRLTFVIDNPVSPHELGISDDYRKLGFGVSSITFYMRKNESSITQSGLK